jgi:hypothetical protein
MVGSKARKEKESLGIWVCEGDDVEFYSTHCKN